MKKEVLIIGGGLAGCEAAWQLGNRRIAVKLYESRKTGRLTDAHKTSGLAELVCSNSFRNDEISSAIGLLHAEMRKLNSLVMQAADHTKVPAGNALAMDRDHFSHFIEEKIQSHPYIEIVPEEISEIPADPTIPVIVATGPLTSGKLAANIQKKTGEEYLAFFDAIAPIIHKETINFDIAWYQSRYDKVGPEGDGKDYINCPLTKDQYHNFIQELLKAEKTVFKEWEMNTPYFNACLPIEVMAERGGETLRFGPMKPVGLTSPYMSEKPCAVVQLRQDNKLGTLYNMVGFQTKMKYGEQKRIFNMIPGLENAEFARLGGLHRNSFIQSPKLLDEFLRLKSEPHIKFAGQITGVEGYVESAAIGLLSGIFTANEINGKQLEVPPLETAIGALLAHITKNASIDDFQPMNVNFGLFPEIERIAKSKKIDRKMQHSVRARQAFLTWCV